MRAARPKGLFVCAVNSLRMIRPGGPTRSPSCQQFPSASTASASAVRIFRLWARQKSRGTSGFASRSGVITKQSAMESRAKYSSVVSNCVSKCTGVYSREPKRQLISAASSVTSLSVFASTTKSGVITWMRQTCCCCCCCGRELVDAKFAADAVAALYTKAKIAKIAFVAKQKVK